MLVNALYCVSAMANRADSRLAGRSVTGSSGAEPSRFPPLYRSQLRPALAQRFVDAGIPSREEKRYGNYFIDEHVRKRCTSF